ncbi:50S ribosomal protein L18 [bacterium HR21]|jgi:large subunit ribosomal protein L18|uniref:Large ribosomal subunit protein uL18 n=1 Tax=uncultured Chlorobiota bacterium TaxID=156405 RepID=H5SGN7_9BACT|nr:50S ribosomal protein L18 [uncultured Chlorobiota bacterium]GBD06702.1 50S ribosomal protein L18 [bacterium HR21]
MWDGVMDIRHKQRLKQLRRHRRKLRVRKKIFGTAERPRLSVYRSLKHIYAQIIDDERGHTLVSASTLDREIRPLVAGVRPKKAQAEIVGRILAERALKLGIQKVAFDRNGYKYHGRVKALAEAARQAGLQF